MSPETVTYRLKAVFWKIGVSKRHDAVRGRVRAGLIALLVSQRAPSSI